MSTRYRGKFPARIRFVTSYGYDDVSYWLAVTNKGVAFRLPVEHNPEPRVGQDIAELHKPVAAPYYSFPSHAIIIRCCWTRGEEQQAALHELASRRLYLGEEQRVQAGVTRKQAGLGELKIAA